MSAKKPPYLSKSLQKQKHEHRVIVRPAVRKRMQISMIPVELQIPPEARAAATSKGNGSCQAGDLNVIGSVDIRMHSVLALSTVSFGLRPDQNHIPEESPWAGRHS